MELNNSEPSKRAVNYDFLKITANLLVSHV